MTVRALVSYHYFRTVDLDTWTRLCPDGLDVFADSGAFSAHTLGITITVDEYAAWCQRWAHHLDVIATLDVIGDAEQTYENTRQLRDRGVPAVPVFHVNEPWEWLDRYLDEGETYIALGGMVGKPVRALIPWALHAHRRAAGRAVFHGFGLTSWRTITTLPWHSVDSSSWKSAPRYGRLPLFDVRTGKWRSFVIGTAVRAAEKHTRRQALYDRHTAALLRSYGMDPDELLAGRYTTNDLEHKITLPLAAAAMQRGEHWLRERNGPVHQPDADAPSGLRLFLAAQPKDGRSLALSATMTPARLVKEPVT